MDETKDQPSEDTVSTKYNPVTLLPDVIRIIQYNKGTDINDLHLRTGESLLNPTTGKRRGSQDIQRLEQEYKDLQEDTADALGTWADVYCLQETAIVPDKCPLVDQLRERKYIAFHFLCKKPDCVVFLRPGVFEISDKSNMSFKYEGSDVAICDVIHKVTQHKLVLVSAHVPGSTITRETCATPELGDAYCTKIANALCPLLKSHIVVMGVDMNANPENCPARFALFKGYDLVRTHKGTAIKFGDSTYSEREIDFVLAHSPFPLIHRMPSVGVTDLYRDDGMGLFTCRFHSKSGHDSVQPLQWDHNASDHAPLYAACELSPSVIPKQANNNPVKDGCIIL